jgi:hypothetical protein
LTQNFYITSILINEEETMGGFKVMLVEADISALRHLLGNIPDVYRILTCGQSESVLENFRKFHPDILVMGPEVSNPEEIRQQIRFLPEGRSVPVLTLAGDRNKRSPSLNRTRRRLSSKLSLEEK